MALIQCSKCSKEVSDRAKICPNCGEQLIVEDSFCQESQSKMIICEECGTGYVLGTKVCPNCGCPAPSENETDVQITQKVEVTSVNLQVKKSTKKNVIIAIVAVIAIALTVFVTNDMQKKKEEQAAIAAAVAAADAYESNLELATISMLSGAAGAEDAGNLIKSVWYNSIYEKIDFTTDKYTRPKGYFYKDFNDALGELFSDDDFQSTISDIESNQELVAGLMKELKNPSEEFEDAYDAIKELYDAYLELTNLATDPQGNLQTYSNNFNEADSNVLKYYKAMDLYIGD